MMISMRLFTKIILRVIAALTLASSLTACQSSYMGKSSKSSSVKKHRKPPNSPFRYKGSFKVGRPYKIKQTKYYPKHYTKYVSVGIASWYGERDGFHGKATANGDIFDKDMLTAAHKTLPLPSMIKVTNLENSKSAILMVNDRGPFSSKRLLDVSEKAAEVLGFKIKGTAKVKVVFLEEETKKLLDKLQLEGVEGSIAMQDILNPTCSVDCYLKTVNMRHNILPSTTTLLTKRSDDSYFVNRLDKNGISKSTDDKHINNQKVASKLALVGSKYSEVSPSIFEFEEEQDQKTQKLKAKPVALNKGQYYIVLGNFKTFAQTKKLLPKVTKFGAARISRNNKTYSIKIGPLVDIAQAKILATKVGKTTGVKAAIIKNNQKV
ncbi:MAG: rare lipoprotein precursor [Rickettsiaceae bacterium]|jgi:rare lipoprotein A|nr:rare lipoprotein precursor [Rickettsiaceae bacterium]